MTYLRTKVRAVGDIITEQTTSDHDGEFEISTPVDKLVFPVLTNISSSLASTSTTMSGTIAADINRLTTGVSNTIFPRKSGSIQLDGITPVQFADTAIQAGERVSTYYTILSGTTSGFTLEILPGVGCGLTGSSDNKSTIFVQIG